MEAKIKRCKHGRIIVKDMSRKKRSVQQSDKETNKKNNNIKNNDNNNISNNNSNSNQTTTIVIEQVSEKTHSIEQSINLNSNSSKQLQPNEDNHLSKSKRSTGTQDCHNFQHHQISDQILEHKTNFPPSKTAQHEASSKKQATARSTNQSPLSNNSPSSDIYDPEGPIIPMSPVDSPPISPFDDAANSNLSYHLNDDKANDDDVPSSAVQLNQQEKYLQKLNRQERAIEEVKVALKPHYQKRSINKEQYKDVLRKAVPKVRCYV